MRFEFKPEDFQCACESYPCKHSSTDWIATTANSIWRAKIQQADKKIAKKLSLGEKLVFVMTLIQLATFVKVMFL